MMFLQRIQTVVVTMTMIGVWSNLYLNYHINITNNKKFNVDPGKIYISDDLKKR